MQEELSDQARELRDLVNVISRIERKKKRLEEISKKIEDAEKIAFSMDPSKAQQDLIAIFDSVLDSMEVLYKKRKSLRNTYNEKYYDRKLVYRYSSSARCTVNLSKHFLISHNLLSIKIDGALLKKFEYDPIINGIDAKLDQTIITDKTVELLESYLLASNAEWVLLEKERKKLKLQSIGVSSTKLEPSEPVKQQKEKKKKEKVQEKSEKKSRSHLNPLNDIDPLYSYTLKGMVWD